LRTVSTESRSEAERGGDEKHVEFHGVSWLGRTKV
jgi:hypothetical protein